MHSSVFSKHVQQWVDEETCTLPLISICVLVTLWTVRRNRGWSCKHECNLSTLCCAWA